MPAWNGVRSARMRFGSDGVSVRGGRITRMDVWNDSAEILLARAGLATM